MIKYCKFENICKDFIFTNMRSFAKIKSSPNVEIILLFTDIGKSRPSLDFLLSQIRILTQFTKIKFSRKFPDLQYSDLHLMVGVMQQLVEGDSSCHNTLLAAVEILKNKAKKNNNIK